MTSRKNYILLLWGLNIILVLLFAIPLSDLSAIFQFFGRLHPLILHFPIVLLLVALLFEFLSEKTNRPEYRQPADLLLLIGAYSAVVSAIAGYLLSIGGGYAGNTILFHKWFGLATSILAALLTTIKNRNALKTAFLPIYIIMVIVLVVTGHYGATLTHGEGFLTEVFEGEKELNLNIQEPIFSQVVLPIFDAKCISCHNPNKLKGGLLLNSEEGLLKGGESGSVLVAGDIQNSKLISHLQLPLEEKLHMPPKGKNQLTNEEIKLLSWWVESGASFTQKVAEIESDLPIQAVLSSYFTPKPVIDIDFASPTQIQLLNNEKISVQQIEPDKPYLEVYIGNHTSLSLDEINGLRKISDQIYSLDLGGSRVDKAIMKKISGFDNLHRLYLDNTDTNDEMLSPLLKLKKLKYLNLYNTKITERGAIQMAKLPELGQLFVWQTALTMDQVRGLQTSFPKINIDGGLPEDSEFTSAQLLAPKLDFSSPFFKDKMIVHVNYSLSGTDLFYQIDGGETRSIEAGTITIDQSAKLSVFAKKEDWEDSPITEQTFVKVAKSNISSTTLRHEPKGDYQSKGVATLFDLRKGSENFRDGEWLGFNGDDLIVNVELKGTQSIESVYVSTIDDIGSWIFPPTQIEVWGGTLPNQLAKLQELSLKTPEGPEPKHTNIHQLKFELKEVKYLRIIAKNYGNLPEWHPGKGTPAWLFIDEIALK